MALAGTSLFEKLVEAGGKKTSTRRLVCQALEQSSDHPTAQQVYERAVKIDTEFSLGTVHRTLRLLKELGLIIRHDFRGETPRYELASPRDHDHLIDTQSGKVIEFHDPELDAIKARIAERYGFDIEGHTFELYGRPTVQSKRQSSAVHSLTSPGRLTRLDKARLRIRPQSA